MLERVSVLSRWNCTSEGATAMTEQDGGTLALVEMGGFDSG
jgi:hypothetical protein